MYIRCKYLELKDYKNTQTIEEDERRDWEVGDWNKPNIDMHIM